MVRCNGKGYPGCDSCVNRESDPFECEDCEDESHWDGDSFDDNFDDDDDFSMFDIAHHIHEDALA